ncbi:hypothetical protein [Bacillus sp. FSL K6-0923]|uniref:hypothetical protein n=1 Tax=Bacillus sp. FSL K6-0923 TaxID=2921454 RepID=UPI00315A15D0
MMKDDEINCREKAIDATGKLSTYLQTIQKETESVQIEGDLHDAKIHDLKLPNIFDNEKGK